MNSELRIKNSIGALRAAVVASGFWLLASGFCFAQSGGGVSHGPWPSSGNGGNASTATNALSLVNFPSLTLSAHGIADGYSTISNNGAMFGIDTPNTSSCGIQEAINSLPIGPTKFFAGGGTLLFGSGTFYTTTTITNPASTNPFTIHFQGVGKTACGITYVGQSPADVIWWGRNTPTVTNASVNLGFYADDMWFASATNAITNIVELSGNRGSIEGGKINNCWFGFWPNMTNGYAVSFAGGQGVTTSVSKIAGQSNNLCPIYIDCIFDDKITIENCSFTYCDITWLAADHVSLLNNMFTACGGGGHYTLLGGSPYVPAVGFGSPVVQQNGNNIWNVRNNDFVECGGGYWVGGGGTHGVSSYEDSFENTGIAVINSAADSSPWVLINPSIHNGTTTNWTGFGGYHAINILAGGKVVNKIGNSPGGNDVWVRFLSGEFYGNQIQTGTNSATWYNGGGNGLTNTTTTCYTNTWSGYLSYVPANTNAAAHFDYWSTNGGTTDLSPVNVKTNSNGGGYIYRSQNNGYVWGASP